MALAIYFDDLIRRGEVRSYAELARIGCVSRSRISQVMDLLNLAPSIQEAILALPSVAAGGDSMTERQLRWLVAAPEWTAQQDLWSESRFSAPDRDC
jgi:hypothetical protein